MAANEGMPAKILAQFLDVSLARVGQLAKEGVITKLPNGKYPNAAITQYIKYIRDKSERKTDYSEKIDAEKYRQMLRENDIAEGKYESVEILQNAFQAISMQIVGILDTLPLMIKRYWPEMTGDQASYVKKAIAECRNIIADSRLKSDAN